MLNARKYLATVTIALLVTLSFSAQAADAPPPALSEMWTMTIKDDQRAEFFEAFKEHMAYRTEAGDPRVWRTYTPLLGDDVGLVAVRYCCFHWADADAYQEWNEANPGISQHWNENVAPHVKSYGHYYDRIDWHNTNMKSGWGPYRYYGVTNFTPKPGKGGEFDAARVEISQIALNHGWATEERPWIWTSNIGGSPTETIVVPYKKYADMDRDPQAFFDFLARVMESDEAADDLFNRFTDNVAEQDYQIWQYHEDLSMKAPD